MEKKFSQAISEIEKKKNSVTKTIKKNIQSKDVVLINGAYGLGEMVVQGAVNPDEFLVFKPTLEKGFESIIEKKMGVKEIKMIYGTNPGEMVKTIPVEKDIQNLNAILKRAQLKGGRMQNSLIVL